MIRNLQCLVALVTLTLPCFSQRNEPGQSLSLPQAIETAQQNYPAIKRKLAEKQAAAQALGVAQTNYLPSFIVQGQVTDATSNQVRGTFFPNEGTAIPVSGGIKTNGYTNDAVWSSFVTGLVNWKFFSFGKYKAISDEAKAGMSTAELDYQNELFQHTVKVSDSYLLELILGNMLKKQRANLIRVKALRDVTASFVKAGLKPGVDSSLVNAEYSKAMLLVLEAQRMADEQEVYLKELLGIAGALSLDLDTTILNKPVGAQITLLKGYDTNPRLIYYKSMVDLNRTRITSIRRKELPSFSLLLAGWGRGSGISDKLMSNGDFAYNSSFSAGVPLRAYNYMIGVSTIWNVTSLFKTNNEARVQRSITDMAERRFQEESLAVESEWERSRLRYQAAVAAVNQAPIQLQAARDAYAQAKASYDAGLITILELTQTFSILNRAEIDVTLAQGNVWRAILQYAAAAGDLNLFTDNLR